MTARVLLVVVAVIAGCFAGNMDMSSTGFFAGSPLVPASILMSGVPECTLTCGAPLLSAIVRAYQFPSNASMAFDVVCQEFTLAEQCIQSTPNCPTPNYFDLFTSGLYFTCVNFRPEFDLLYSSLGSSLPAINQVCSQQCNLASIVAAFNDISMNGQSVMTSSLGSNVDEAIRQGLLTSSLDTMCSGVDCVLDCIGANMNATNADFSEFYMKAAILPWVVTGAYINSLPNPQVKSFFATVVPSSCWTLMDPSQVFPFPVPSIEGSGIGASGMEASGIEASGMDN